MLEFIGKINWVDVFLLIIILRICYVSWHIGVGKQILPLFFLVFILVLSFHNYAKIGQSWINVFGMARSVSRFISFLLLVIIPTVISKHINKFWMNVTGDQGPLPLFERIGGVILGLVRANIIVGLVVAGLLLMPVTSIENSVGKGSFLSDFFINSNANIYCAIINIFSRTEKKDPRSVEERFEEEKDYKLELFDLKAKSKRTESE